MAIAYQKHPGMVPRTAGHTAFDLMSEKMARLCKVTYQEIQDRVCIVMTMFVTSETVPMINVCQDPHLFLILTGKVLNEENNFVIARRSICKLLRIGSHL